MQDVEIFADLVQKLARDVRDEIAALSPEELVWQPDAEGNSIGVTVWHFSRWLDVLVVQVLENRPAEQEQWFTRGWAQRTGYDPRGVGYRGLGVLTGYTQPEVAAIPALPAEELLSYLDQVTGALRQHLLGMGPGALYQPAPGLGGKRSAYEWLTTLLMGCFGHVGEIEALKAMRARALALANPT
jgi:DinB family protein